MAIGVRGLMNSPFNVVWPAPPASPAARDEEVVREQSMVSIGRV